MFGRVLSCLDFMWLLCAGPSYISLVVAVFSCTCRTAHNHAYANTISPAPATAPLRIQEFDVGLIYHVRLTPARSSMDGLCLACRSSDAVQKVFIFPSVFLLMPWTQPHFPLHRMFAEGVKQRQWSRSDRVPTALTKLKKEKNTQTPKHLNWYGTPLFTHFSLTLERVLRLSRSAFYGELYCENFWRRD